MNIQTVTFNGISFVKVTKPQELEIKDLKKNFGFNSLDLEDYIHRTQIPTIKPYKDYVLIVLDFPFFKQNSNESGVTNGSSNKEKEGKEKIEKLSIATLLNIPHATLSSIPLFHFTSVKTRRVLTSHVNLFVGKDYVVVLNEGILAPIDHIFSQCQKSLHNRENYMGQGSVFLAYKIIDALVDNCFSVINELIVMIEKIDQELEHKKTQIALEEISFTRRNIVFFQTMIKSALPLFKELREGQYKELNRNMTFYWSNIHDHLKKIAHRLDDSRELMEGISKSHESYLTQKTNRILAVLTIIFTYAIPATVIGTFYGMNVLLPGGVESGSWIFWGEYTTFIIILIASTLPTIFMFWYFKKKEWL